MNGNIPKSIPEEKKLTVPLRYLVDISTLDTAFWGQMTPLSIWQAISVSHKQMREKAVRVMYLQATAEWAPQSRQISLRFNIVRWGAMGSIRDLFRSVSTHRLTFYFVAVVPILWWVYVWEASKCIVIGYNPVARLICRLVQFSSTNRPLILCCKNCLSVYYRTY